jgi:excinuclease UvrABC nuclease subunit
MYPRDLKFLKDLAREKPDGVIKKMEDGTDFKNVPDKPGAYILLSEKERFIYPTGTSKVIYIGMGKSLLNRIKQHLKHMNELKGIPKKYRRDYWYYSRYNFLVQFGCKVYWFTARGTQNPKDLESTLIEEFYSKYHSIPIGNGAFSYKRGEAL